MMVLYHYDGENADDSQWCFTIVDIRRLLSEVFVTI
jgi:hypothetical protein